MRILIFLVFVLRVSGEKMRSKDCRIPLRQKAAPVFDSGENLSWPNCGVWDKEKSATPPWRIYIKGPRHYACSGILISPTAALTWGCEELTYEFAKAEDKSDYKALLGKCFEERYENNHRCAEIGAGHVSQMLQVTKLEVGHSDGLYLWKLEKVRVSRSRIWPICLFNKNNQRDFQLGQNYSVVLKYDWRQSNSAELVADVASCLKKEISVYECVSMNTSICVQNPGQPLDFLLHLDSNRFYLRGIYNFHGTENHNMYTDVLYFVDEIAAKTSDIFILPNIPTPRNKTDFGGRTSFANCGVKGARVDLFRRKRGIVCEGEDHVHHQHPWHAALVSKGCLVCGGTLISRTAVLTAAHCVYEKGELRNSSELRVVLGMDKIFSEYERNNGQRQRLYPSRMLPHPNYKASERDHDVALLLFDEPGFNLTHSVRPICLWDKSYDFSRIAGKSGEVVGWGATDEQEKVKNLIMTTLRVDSYLECYLKDRKFFSKSLKPGINFCADLDGSEACAGDSGGGFALKKGERWFLRGVVSHRDAIVNSANRRNDTIRVCDKEVPSLFVDLAESMDWIFRNVDFSPYFYDI